MILYSKTKMAPIDPEIIPDMVDDIKDGFDWAAQSAMTGKSSDIESALQELENLISDTRKLYNVVENLKDAVDNEAGANDFD
jgi:hypothetical protein